MLSLGRPGEFANGFELISRRGDRLHKTQQPGQKAQTCVEYQIKL